MGGVWFGLHKASALFSRYVLELEPAVDSHPSECRQVQPGRLCVLCLTFWGLQAQAFTVLTLCTYLRYLEYACNAPAFAQCLHKPELHLHVGRWHVVHCEGGPIYELCCLLGTYDIGSLGYVVMLNAYRADRVAMAAPSGDTWNQN
jgi:hypothetical protein